MLCNFELVCPWDDFPVRLFESRRANNTGLRLETDLLGFFLVLAASLLPAIGGDQLSVMNSQDEILRTRKFTYRHSLLQQLLR